MHLLDTGGHIYDMAWAPQAEADSTCSSSPDAEWLAIARAPDRTTRSLVDAPLPGGSIQIWKFPLHQSTPTLHVVLESEGGTPLRLAWQPKQTGGLGVLAATYADGSVRMMRVPSEEAPTSIAADNVRILRLASACFSLDWQGDRLAVGCVNGDVAVWDVASDLPLVHAPVHDTLVSAVRWQALPPVTINGIPDAAQQPTTLLSLGWDGTELVSDVHSMYTPVRLAHTRGTCFVSYSPRTTVRGCLGAVRRPVCRGPRRQPLWERVAAHARCGPAPCARLPPRAHHGARRVVLPSVRRERRDGRLGQVYQRARRGQAQDRGREPRTSTD